jgi:serine protease
MKPKGRAKWGLSLVLALAPILALAACDQIKAIADRFEKGMARQEAPGPAPLGTVDIRARAMAGKILSPAAREATLEAAPVMFLPGEVIVGAKVTDKIMAMAPPGQAAALRAQFAAGARPAPIDPALERAATEAAVADATKGARIVLDRLGVDAAVQVNAGGVLTIDLTPPRASPTQLTDSTAAPAPPTPEPAPQAVAETNVTCPKGVTAEQLDADLVLKTQCTIERLKAARQFAYVEKNYVIGVEFDRIPWPAKKPATPMKPPASPAPAPTPQGAAPDPLPQPSTPAPVPAAPPAEAAGLPNDPLLPFQWDLRPRGDGPGQSPGGAGFEDFWIKAKQTGARSVRVAVIDTGIDKAHPDIAASQNIAPGIDLIADPERAGDGDGVDANADDSGDQCGAAAAQSYHGTHVAGTIGAAVTNDRKGVAAAAWNVTIIPIRVIGKCGGELTDIVNAIRWAVALAPAQTASGQLIANPTPADIINMSISVGIPCPASMQAAIDAAVARGALVVVAAGNKAKPVRDYAPANCNNVIAVAANDEAGRLSYYSNFGPGVKVMAPGGDVFQDADGDGRPDGILSTRATAADCFDPQTGLPATNCYYSYLQGTSMAAPHVSAALALLKAQLHVSGKQLEDAFLIRALSPIDPAQCAISCAKNPGDGPLADQPGLCMRRCGQGMLDMTRAAAQP